MITNVVLSVSIVILLCVLSQKFSYRLGIPALIFFMFVGMLFGSEGIFKILYDDFSSAEMICSIALIFIMFQGGFETNWNTAKRYVVKSVMLSTIGVLVTAIITTGCCHYLLKLSLQESFLIASVLASTDAASVFAILKSNNLDLKDGTSSILEVESGSNDPVAYLLTVTAIGIMKTGQVSNIAVTIVVQLVVGFLSGILFAFLSKYILSKKNAVADGLDTIFIISTLMLCYALTDKLGGNAYLSVYLMGLYLGNSRLNAKGAIIAFFDDLVSLLQMLVFFIIGLLSTPSEMPKTIPLALCIVAILTFVSRPLMTLLLLTPFGCRIRQCLLISWAGLRGASSIVFAITAVSSGVYLSMDLFHVVFMVSLFSIAIQGALLPAVSKKLDMIDENPDITRTFSDYDETVDFQFTRVKIDSDNSWVNKRIKDLDLPYGSQVIMIKRDGKTMAARGSSVVKKNDVLIMNVPAYHPESKERVEELHISKDHPWIGRSLAEIRIPDDQLMIVIIRGDDKIIPNGKTVVEEGDVALIFKGE